MRVLVVSNTYLFPSDVRPTAGVFFYNFFRCLRQHVDAVTVVSPTALTPTFLAWMPRFAHFRRPAFFERRDGIDIYRPVYLSLRRHYRMATQARPFAESARKFSQNAALRHGADVVVGTSLGMEGHTATLVAEELNLPAVNWAIGSDVHTSPHRSAENFRFLQRTCRRSSAVLSVSGALREELLSYCPGAENVIAFHRGIDLSSLARLQDRRTLRARLGLDPDALYMISVGAVHEGKGLWEFYEAFRRLSADRPRLRAIWLGSGPQMDALRASADRDGLGDRLTTPGRVPHATVLEHFQAADVMAFASHREGLPNVVVEAMAAGLATVASAVGGTPEVIDDGRTGRLVPPKDADALTEAVGEVLGRSDRGRSMAEAGRRDVFERFDVRKNAARAADLLARLADEHRG